MMSAANCTGLPLADLSGGASQCELEVFYGFLVYGEPRAAARRRCRVRKAPIPASGRTSPLLTVAVPSPAPGAVLIASCCLLLLGGQRPAPVPQYALQVGGHDRGMLASQHLAIPAARAVGDLCSGWTPAGRPSPASRRCPQPPALPPAALGARAAGREKAACNLFLLSPLLQKSAKGEVPELLSKPGAEAEAPVSCAPRGSAKAEAAAARMVGLQASLDAAMAQLAAERGAREEAERASAAQAAELMDLRLQLYTTQNHADSLAVVNKGLQVGAAGEAGRAWVRGQGVGGSGRRVRGAAAGRGR